MKYSFFDELDLNKNSISSKIELTKSLPGTAVLYSLYLIVDI